MKDSESTHVFCQSKMTPVTVTAIAGYGLSIRDRHGDRPLTSQLEPQAASASKLSTSFRQNDVVFVL